MDYNISSSNQNKLKQAFLITSCVFILLEMWWFHALNLSSYVDQKDINKLIFSILGLFNMLLFPILFRVIEQEKIEIGYKYFIVEVVIFFASFMTIFDVKIWILYLVNIVAFLGEIVAIVLYKKSSDISIVQDSKFLKWLVYVLIAVAVVVLCLDIDGVFIQITRYNKPANNFTLHFIMLGFCFVYNILLAIRNTFKSPYKIRLAIYLDLFWIYLSLMTFMNLKSIPVSVVSLIALIVCSVFVLNSNKKGEIKNEKN